VPGRPWLAVGNRVRNRRVEARLALGRPARRTPRANGRVCPPGKNADTAGTIVSTNLVSVYHIVTA
jgi:hypothetical protein